MKRGTGGNRKLNIRKKTKAYSGKFRDESNFLKPLKVFGITLFSVLLVGMVLICVMVFLKNQELTSDSGTESAQYTKANPPGEMVEVPIAGTKETIAVETEEVQVEEIEVDEYTHLINSSTEDSVTIGFAGDILFDPNYAIMNTIKNSGGIAGVIDSALIAEMQAVDIMMLNNEFPYSNRGTALEGKTYTFRADPSSASMLNDIGVDIVSLANNHAYDYGEAAFLDSMTTLDEYGIVYSGAGNNIEEASHPIYYIADNGIKIAIISATQIERLENPDTKGATESSAGVFRCLDDTLLLQRIQEAKEQNAFVIVFIHWGTESQTEIDWWQEKQANEITLAGADLIIGCHPHILQEVGYVNDVPVVYSLGNYLFNSKTLDTCMVEATIHTDGTLNLQFIPAIQSGCHLTMATGADYLRILNYMTELSSTASFDSNGYISKKWIY